MTMDDRAQELLNTELDGELDAAGRLELDALLAAQPELRREREALRGLARRLREVPDLEPPADLAARVAAAANLPPAMAARSRWRLPHWAPGPMALPFTALAAGLVVAVVTFWQPPGTGLDDSVGMVGSMVQGRAPAGQPGELAVSLQAVTGQVTLGSAVGGERVLEFELSSANPVDIEINLGESGLGFSGFNGGVAGVELVANAAGTLRLRSQGEGRFAVRLRDADTAPASGARLELTLSAQDRELYRGVLSTR